jgi:oligogalacturonide lyase
VIARRTVLGLAAAALATPAFARQASAPSTAPPKDWIDPKTGHRIVRLSEEGGSKNLYFHQHGYTPQGDKLAITTPSGIALVDLKTFKLAPVPKTKGADLMFFPRRSRRLYYSVTAPGEGLPVDRAKTIYALDIDSGKAKVVGKLDQGQIASVNADETLLLGVVT